MELSLALCDDVRSISRDRPGKADIVVFPELVDGGYAALAAGKGTHTANDDFFQAFGEFSRRLRALVVAGTARVAGAAGGATNTAMVFHRGKRVCRYDKIHLFHPAGDHRYFRRGESLCVSRVSMRGRRIRFGVIICFDLRFPELARTMAMRGTEILFVPARWPATRRRAWHTLLQARAIENQMFVVGCTARGREGGPSFVFDPTGSEVVYEKKKAKDGWKKYILDLGMIQESRRGFDTRRESVLLNVSRPGIRG